MISTLVKKIMVAQGLTQKEMADLLETSVDRIKSLSSGRTKNFTIEESQILVKTVGIRAEWLITGEGEMFTEQDLPADLSIDEQILLQAYRDASVLEKKKIFADIIGQNKTTKSVANNHKNSVKGQQIGNNNQQHNHFASQQNSSINIENQHGGSNVGIKNK
ncbi:helix-turn-helix transcriptional regulator [Acinetobacter haemolyticus]|uniref:XRE family transcriptional regulator n=1 Tax=Acinetobacter haemolyticus TaxID=29430 RepID=UPI0034D6B95C